MSPRARVELVEPEPSGEITVVDRRSLGWGHLLGANRALDLGDHRHAFGDVRGRPFRIVRHEPPPIAVPSKTLDLVPPAGRRSLELHQDGAIHQRARRCATRQAHDGPVSVPHGSPPAVHRRPGDADGEQVRIGGVDGKPHGIGVRRLDLAIGVSGGRAEIGIRGHTAAGDEIDDRRLNRLDPQAVRARVEPDLERGPRLAGSRPEPSSHQIRQLIPRRASGTGDVAELLGEAELPHRAVRQSHVGLSVGQLGADATRQLENRISLVPQNLADESFRRGAALALSRAVLRQPEVHELAGELRERLVQLGRDLEAQDEPISVEPEPGPTSLLFRRPGLDGVLAPIGDPLPLSRTIEIMSPFGLDDVGEELGRAPQQRMAAECQLAQLDSRGESASLEHGAEGHHLETLGHLGGLDLTEKGGGDLEDASLGLAEITFAPDEVEPPTVSLAKAARQVTHPLELACRGTVAALESQLAVHAFDLVGAGHPEEAGEKRLRLELELDRATGGQLFRFVRAEEAPQRCSRDAPAEREQRAQTLEKHPMVADEIDDGDGRLSFARPKAATELLQEHDARLRRPQHDDPVDRGNVDALVEHVDRTHGVETAGIERGQGGVAIVRALARKHGGDSHAPCPQPAADEDRVSNAAAEEQRTATGVCLPRAPQRLHSRFGLRGGRERVGVEPAVPPRDVLVVDVVLHPEIVKWRQPV